MHDMKNIIQSEPEILYRPILQGDAAVRIGQLIHHVYVSTIIDSRTISVRDDLAKMAVECAQQQGRWMAEARIEQHGNVTVYIHPMAMLTKIGNDVRRASFYDIDKLRGGDGYHYKDQTQNERKV